MFTNADMFLSSAAQLGDIYHVVFYDFGICSQFRNINALLYIYLLLLKPAE
jgi:hypothetical protein